MNLSARMATWTPAFSKTVYMLKSLSVRPNVYFTSIHRAISSHNDTPTMNSAPSKDFDSDMPLEDAENPFEREKIKCILCEHNIKVDYKNVRLLSQFVSRYTGRVYGRHITRLCKRQQERVENEIAKSQSAGLMGSYTRDLAYAHDPQLFNPERPIRPHRF